MRLKTQFVLISTAATLLIIGIMVLLFITAAPRANVYEIDGPDVPVATEYLSELTGKNILVTDWYTILYSFSIIQNESDLDSCNDNIEFFTRIDPDTEITSLEYIGPPYVTSTREYVNFQNYTGTHTFFFSETKNPKYQYRITGKTYNLRNRQTGICLFYVENDILKGYLLNNVLLRARQNIEVFLQLKDSKEFVEILDFDGNSYQIVSDYIVYD